MGFKKTIKEWELGLWASNLEEISITDRARMVNWICDNWRAEKMIYGIYEDGELVRLRATCDVCGVDIADPSEGTEGERYICYKCEKVD